MDTTNLNELSVQEAQKINGGSPWPYIAVALGEIVDVITSGGENLEEAYQNGYEAAKN